MSRIPFASAVGSLMYAMLCTRPDICYAVGIVSRYQSDPGEEHWIALKHILKYLRRTRDYMLVYSSGSLETIGYTDSDFQGDIDSRKSTSEENLADPFTKTLLVRVFEKHVDYMSVKSLPDLFLRQVGVYLCFLEQDRCVIIFSEFNNVRYSSYYCAH